MDFPNIRTSEIIRVKAKANWLSALSFIMQVISIFEVDSLGSYLCDIIQLMSLPGLGLWSTSIGLQWVPFENYEEVPASLPMSFSFEKKSWKNFKYYEWKTLIKFMRWTKNKLTLIKQLNLTLEKKEWEGLYKTSMEKTSSHVH